MTKKEMKQWIDSASYEELLRKWRFAPSGDPFFSLDIGDYFKSIMKQRKSELSVDQQVAASKSVGWG